MNFNQNQINEEYFNMSDLSKKPQTGFPEEISQQLYVLEEWKQQKNEQQTTCQVEEPEYCIDEMYEVYDKYEPYITKKTQELEKKVDMIKENEISMPQGNSVHQFNECLKDQIESKKQFFLQIFYTLRQLFEQRYFLFDIININQRDLDNLQFTFELKFDEYFKKIHDLIESKLDQDFKSLCEKTKEYKLKCEKVYAYQIPEPKQIPSQIEEIQKESYNENKQILDQTQKEEAFILTCCKVNMKMMSVFKKKQLNQPLSQEELKQFNAFQDFLKKNQHSLQFLNQQLSEQDISDILEQFQDKLNEGIENLSSPALLKKSKKISK